MLQRQMLMANSIQRIFCNLNIYSRKEPTVGEGWQTTNAQYSTSGGKEIWPLALWHYFYEKWQEIILVCVEGTGLPVFYVSLQENIL